MRKAEHSQIGSATLINSKELAFLVQNDAIKDPEIDKIWQSTQGSSYLQDVLRGSDMANVSSWSGVPRMTNLASQKSLKVALEEMFQQIVVSLMNSPSLGPDTSEPDAAAAKVTVSIQNWETYYVYDGNARVRLWLAYGLAIGLSLCTLIVGAFAMVANDASYSNSFSTMLLAGLGSKLSARVADIDKAGSDPLPSYLKKVTVNVVTGRQAGEEMEISSRG